MTDSGFLAEVGRAPQRAEKAGSFPAFSGVGEVITKGVEWADKPSSVESVHLSGTAVARSLKRPTRGSCGVGPTPSVAVRRSGGERIAPYLALLRAGFCQPVCRHTAGALLPHHFTLARLRRSHRGIDRCDLGEGGRCVSVPLFRRVAPPGRYPAPCPVELGLSSTAFRRPRTLGPLQPYCSTLSLKR